MKPEQEELGERVWAFVLRALDASDYAVSRLEFEAALALLKSANAADQERRQLEAIVLMNYAQLAEHKGDLETAVTLNSRLLVDDPGDLASELALVSLHRRLAAPDVAERSLRRAGELAEDAGNANVLALLATAGYLPAEEPVRTLRLDAAIQSYLARLDAEQSPATMRRGSLQYGLGSLYSQKAQAHRGRERVGLLVAAVEAYRGALVLYPRTECPDEHATIEQRLHRCEQLLTEAEQDAKEE